MLDKIHGYSFKRGLFLQLKISHKPFFKVQKDTYKINKNLKLEKSNNSTETYTSDIYGSTKRILKSNGIRDNSALLPLETLDEAIDISTRIMYSFIRGKGEFTLYIADLGKVETLQIFYKLGLNIINLINIYNFLNTHYSKNHYWFTVKIKIINDKYNYFSLVISLDNENCSIQKFIKNYEHYFGKEIPIGEPENTYLKNNNKIYERLEFTLLIEDNTIENLYFFDKKLWENNK